MKAILAFTTVISLSACAVTPNQLPPCPVWTGHIIMEGNCDDRGGSVNPDLVPDCVTDCGGPSVPDEPVGPTDPVDPVENEPDPEKVKDNKGHGNGDEGDCRGGGCSDPDNPGKGRSK